MRPDWLDPTEYPFASHYLERPMGRLHYLDEGQGDPIVLVHGTPDWSFLYRNVIKALTPTHRCIALDHIGFGLSDKPADWPYRLADHANNLSALIDHLGLTRYTLVVHDFGGPIGLAHALNHPDQIERLAISNTWLWSLRDDPAVAWPLAIMGGPIGKYLYLRHNFSTRFIMKAAWGKANPLTPAIHRHYIKAVPKPSDRLGMWRCAWSGLGESDWYDSLWRRRDALRDKPMQFIWGLQDPAFGRKYLARWQAAFPQAKTVTLNQAGHFPPDECAAEFAAAIAAKGFGF